MNTKDTAHWVSSTSELAQRDEWVKQNLLSRNGNAPLSFTYGGQRSGLLLPAWKRRITTTRLDEKRIEQTILWTDPQSGLEITCRAVVYDEFPTVEWVVDFKNTGRSATPILANIQGLHATFVRRLNDEFILHHHKGDTTAPDSYEPQQVRMEKSTQHNFAPTGGRPTFIAYPFFNFEFDNGGIIAVIGWPGQWAANFVRDAASTLQVIGGQEMTSLKLLPGESVRSPLIVLQFWKGNYVRSQNIWRRWMLAYGIPLVAGEPPPPLLVSMMGVGPVQTAANQISFIDGLHRNGIKVDYWWLDAGWYPCVENWTQVGTWESDVRRFPDGIKAVANHAHAKGMKFIVWFEPERVCPGSRLYNEHPQWLLSRNSSDKLLNLGNPEAREWLTDHIDDFLTHQGVDLYRQDFNTDPLEFWRGHDEPDRQGITENLYVQGYLAFFDELRRRHPTLLIDSCASGGRRNDLETLRRAIPLMHSDFESPQGKFFSKGNPMGLTVGNQGHTYGFASWVPSLGNIAFTDDDYDRRSHLGISFGLLPRELWNAIFMDIVPQTQIDQMEKQIDWTAFRRAANEWKQVADYFYGDYYPLTEYNLASDRWIAWQFDRPETGTGLIQVFRRHEATEAMMTFTLHGLAEAATYELRDFDAPNRKRLTGRQLMKEGLTVNLPIKPQSALITYSRVTNESIEPPKK